MVGIGTLNSYVNKHISAICPNHYDSDGFNHCAHFVAHSLEIMVGVTCYGIVGGQKGASGSLRVDEIFSRWCTTVGEWGMKPSGSTQGLIFITNNINVSIKAKSMKSVPTKHIGIFVGGDVWHYSNSRHKVVSVPVTRMMSHFPSPKDNSLFYGTLR